MKELPIHRRITLDDFLAFTGWTMTADMSHTMQVALDFYQDQVPRHILMQKAPRPSPWSLPQGNVIKLSELMQAIDFHRPVTHLMAPLNRRFKCFRPRSEPKSQIPKGNWFTEMSAHQQTLAIPGEQDLVRVYRVKLPVHCLKSNVSDAFTWIRCSIENIKHETAQNRYYHGGGCQYFIWEPRRYLSSVSTHMLTDLTSKPDYVELSRITINVTCETWSVAN